MHIPQFIGRRWKRAETAFSELWGRQRPLRKGRGIALLTPTAPVRDAPGIADTQQTDADEKPAALGLALQGGGAHGAFTWGVLDRIFEDPPLHVKAISGASAGALNAVVAANGLLVGGPEGARAELETFWRSVSDNAAYSPSFLDTIMNGWDQTDRAAN